MKIFFRYLFVELLIPLLFCLVATSALFIVVDLYDTLPDFVSNSAPISLIVKFYAAQLPKMLEMTLPVSILFSSLYVLITLSRRSELIALQAGGLSPVLIYSPFLVMAGICTIVLFVVMAWPATQSEFIRERILRDLGTSPEKRNTYRNVTYVDLDRHRIWHICHLDVDAQQALDVEIVQRDAQGRDLEKINARAGEYLDGRWRLTQVKQMLFNENHDVVEQRKHVTLDLNGYATTPEELAYTISKPNQLTLNQISDYLSETADADALRLAPYRTQFWSLFSYPSIIPILVVFAIGMGSAFDRRRGAAAGVFNAIFVLLAFYFVIRFFEAMGGGNRISPFVAAWAGPVLFGAAGALLLAWKFGWLWQARRWWQAHEFAWLRGSGSPVSEMMPSAARDLRLKSLKILLDKVTRQHPNFPGGRPSSPPKQEPSSKK